MGRDRDVPGEDQQSSKLNRMLIEEFYKDSVDQYGTDSEQARTLLRLLSSIDSGGPEKGD